MYSWRAYFIIGFIATYTALVNGHSDGAPVSACDTMAVSHDNEGGAQTDACPFMVMPGKSTLEAGSRTTVYIMSDDDTDYFEGILLKAINAEQAPDDCSGSAGYFIIDPDDQALYKTLDCSDASASAITHCSAVNKTEVTFTWQAPDTAGTYAFVLTIAESHDVYYQPIRSATVQVTGAGVMEHANMLAVFAIALVAIVKSL